MTNGSTNSKNRMRDMVDKVNGLTDLPKDENTPNTLGYNLNKTKHASSIQTNWSNIPNTLNYNLNKTKHASSIQANWNMVEGYKKTKGSGSSQ